MFSFQNCFMSKLWQIYADFPHGIAQVFLKCFEKNPSHLCEHSSANVSRCFAESIFASSLWTDRIVAAPCEKHGFCLDCVKIQASYSLFSPSYRKKYFLFGYSFHPCIKKKVSELSFVGALILLDSNGALCCEVFQQKILMQNVIHNCSVRYAILFSHLTIPSLFSFFFLRYEKISCLIESYEYNSFQILTGMVLLENKFLGWT